MGVIEICAGNIERLRNEQKAEISELRSEGNHEEANSKQKELNEDLKSDRDFYATLAEYTADVAIPGAGRVMKAARKLSR